MQYSELSVKISYVSNIFQELASLQNLRYPKYFVVMVNGVKS